MEKYQRQDIVVYKNEFNTIPLRNFTSIEMNLLFSIMSKLRDRGLTEVTLSFHELKNLSNYNKVHRLNMFVNDLERTYDKLINLNVKIGDEKKWTKFVFFTRYSIDKDNQTVNIAVNPEFRYIINELTDEFTKFELKEVVKLKSSYSKSLYKLLKQFRATGYVSYDINTFKKLLCIPESYKMCNIDQRILKPAVKELSQYFEWLKYKKIFGRGRYSRTIVKIEFTFYPQNDLDDKLHKTFRDEDGYYYDKHFDNFTREEIDKAFKDDFK